MYSPRQIGISQFARTKVAYREFPAPEALRNTIYCTWELRTIAPLEKDFLYLILPDACGDIIFDMQATDADSAAFTMISSTDAEEINLGKDFWYCGIRMLPGVLHTETDAIYTHADAAWRALCGAECLDERQAILARYTQQLLNDHVLSENYLMRQLLTNSESLHKVSDIEELTGYTRRQLQRIIKQQTGFTPHDFLKILRFQQTLAEQQHYYYADQSHYIREFKQMTGITPKIFKARY